jgi:alkanesulfonate monooxygenase SsuD/methylene tetrahydromethanopterin reductase-like flavin-dependent oxidoreductase (luciferase family)
MTNFGVQLSTAMCGMTELREAWRRVEDLGFDWISGQDHFYTMRAPKAGSFEALTTHAALAALTTRPRVGTLVYAAGYRNPAVMANALVTIDHLSNGRLEVGMGAGWLRAEFEDYGMRFDPTPVRLRQLREAVTIIRSLWANDTTDFDGEFYQLHNARCDPKPIQRSPRIWVGAAGPKALKVAAEIGDGWNANFISPELFAQRVGELREMAPDPNRLAISASAPLIVADEARLDEVMRYRYGATAEQQKPAALAGSVAQITDKVGRYVEAGADWIIIALRPPFEFDELETFATHVVPQFAPRR